MSPSDPPSGCAVVIGASGGIGRALTTALVAQGRYARVHALSRSGTAGVEGALSGRADVTDEASLAAAAGAIEEPLELVIVASGRLQGEGVSPERSLADLNLDALTRSFQVNAIGPALAAKHFAPRLRRDRRTAFAALSARVGSIGDNRLGGWYSYRASKAALNMLMRTLAVELARTRPLAVCAALHPGTVDTALSRPFQRGVAAERLFTADHSAARLLQVLDHLAREQSGGFFAYDGEPIAF